MRSESCAAVPASARMSLRSSSPGGSIPNCAAKAASHSVADALMWVMLVTPPSALTTLRDLEVAISSPQPSLATRGKTVRCVRLVEVAQNSASNDEGMK